MQDKTGSFYIDGGARVSNYGVKLALLLVTVGMAIVSLSP